VWCPKLTALRHKLRVVWALLKEEDFRCTRSDWLLLLLDKVDDATRARVLLLFWRAWSLRNNVMHGDGACMVMSFAKFLERLVDSMDQTARDSKGGGDDKGKRPISGEGRRCAARQVERPQQRWMSPATGWVKLNTDASFYKETGETGLGMIVRDPEGKALLAAWREMRGCGSPEQAEAEAWLEGMRLTAEWVRQPTLVETYCKNLISDIQKPVITWSGLAGILEEIKGVQSLMVDCQFEHVYRGANEVTHALAQRASRYHESVVMGPEATEVCA
jgi:hypothetical protein